MPRKKSEKQTTKKEKKKTTRKPSSSSDRMSKSEMDKLLIENFVTLQRVLTNLSIKFDSLTDQISKLLSLFEISAKSFAEKQGTSMTTEDREFLDKLDQLMEQNKLIAKGLTIMSERSQPPQQPLQQQRIQHPETAGRPIKRPKRR